MTRSIPDLTVGADLPRGFPRPWPVRGDGGRPVRYVVMQNLSRLTARGYFRGRLHVEGIENVPREGGPLIIAANHLSNLDPMIIGAYSRGANCAMAKVELYRHPLAAWMLGGSNCFPVDRGAADRWALRTALSMLEHGGRLMLWVEGTRGSKAAMRRAEPGVGFLLRRRPAAVLPVAVTGTHLAMERGRKLPRRVPISIRFGTPVTLDLSGARDNQLVADRVGALIAALLPEEYRGVYAEPALAILGGAAP
jgi:1-acyl-sn-glycerol-3-phosphate acyltransferase